MTTYGFYVEIAQKYGLDVSALLYNMIFWIRANKANRRHFHDGRYWTYNSAQALCELFPFWSRKKIQRLLKECEEKGLLVSGNYNDNAFNQTKWYALGDSLLLLLKNSYMDCSKTSNVDWPHAPTPLDTYDQSFIGADINITDINTDNKHNENTNVFSMSNSSNSDESVPDYAAFVSFFNKTVSDANSIIPRIIRFTPQRQDALRARIKDYSYADCETVVKKAAESPFLNGRTDKAWTACDFEWMFKPSNFLKILEGKYDPKTTPAKSVQEKKDSYYQDA